MNFIILVTSSQKILWNSASLTKRQYEKKRDLKWEVTIPPFNWYYTNFPDRISNLFPMYGTQDINTNEANELEVKDEAVIAFMITKNIGNWFTVPINGWEIVDTGSFLGPESTDIILYEKFLKPGIYSIDNNSSYYLFTKGNNFSIARRVVDKFVNLIVLHDL